MFAEQDVHLYRDVLLKMNSVIVLFM